MRQSLAAVPYWLTSTLASSRVLSRESGRPVLYRLPHPSGTASTQLRFLLGFTDSGTQSEGNSMALSDNRLQRTSMMCALCRSGDSLGVHGDCRRQLSDAVRNQHDRSRKTDGDCAGALELQAGVGSAD